MAGHRLHQRLIVIVAIVGMALPAASLPGTAAAQSAGRSRSADYAVLVAAINDAYGTRFAVPRVDEPGQAVRLTHPMAPNTPARAGGTNG